MKRLITLFALALMMVSGGAYAAEYTHTTSDGTVMYANTDTGEYKVTRPDGTTSTVTGFNIINPQSDVETTASGEPVVITVAHTHSNINNTNTNDHNPTNNDNSYRRYGWRWWKHRLTCIMSSPRIRRSSTR